MTTFVSQGQFTIVDNNDAKPLSYKLLGSQAIQQIYSKNTGAAVYIPSYYDSPYLVITPQIIEGGLNGATDLSTNTTKITNRRWSKSLNANDIWDGTNTTQDTSNFVTNNGSTPMTTPFQVAANGISLTIKGNIKPSTKIYPIVFQADYTDPDSGFTTKIVDTIYLTFVETGTNAVFINIRGQNAVSRSDGALGTQNKTVLCADLIRGSGPDRADLQYKWYQVIGGTATQISTSLSGYATKFALSDTAIDAVPQAAAIDGGNIPSSGSYSSYNSSGVGVGNTLTIGESAVNDISVFKVDIYATDDLNTYSTYFTVYDLSDPYDVKITSSIGDKFQNGVGTTLMSQRIYHGQAEVDSATLNLWSFVWTLYNADGKRAAFVDQTSAAAAAYYNAGAGKAIGTNAYNTSTRVLTHAAVGTAASVGTNNIVKIVKTNGVVLFYEITAATTTTVTLSNAPSVLSLTDYPLPAATNDLQGAVVYLCTLNGIRNTRDITVTGYDIDKKGLITCDAYKPI